MSVTRAALGSAAFFIAAPGTVAGLVPWLITGWQVRQGWPPWAMGAGAIVVVAGLAPLVHAFVEFARAGGTPAPVAPTERLVVTGFHHYVRNPMYLGVTGAVLGQSLLLGHLGLALYGAVAWAVMAAFVRWYEEPTLHAQFGAEYETYRAMVPAWLPHPRPGR